MAKAQIREFTGTNAQGEPETYITVETGEVQSGPVVSGRELDACIDMHRVALVTAIRDLERSPMDGAILTLIQTIKALEAMREPEIPF